MYLMNSGNQFGQTPAYRVDGSLSTTAPKLILPRALSRSFLMIQNTGAATLRIEHGCARATVSLSSGALNTFTILNGGFGFTKPPIVQLKGGGGQYVTAATGAAWDGRGQVDQWPTPDGSNLLVTPPTQFRIGKAHAVLTAGVVTSIVVDDPGAGYVNLPDVELFNDPIDPFGCADPTASGLSLATATAPLILNGTFCPTDAIAVQAASATSFYVSYAP